MRLSKKRKEMGEIAWGEYQRQRELKKSLAWRSRNPEKAILIDQKSVEKRRFIKKVLIAYKGGKCELCGFCKDVSGAYDFHHIDPTQKDFDIGSCKAQRRLDEAKREVDKCQLLCRNCHAEVHQAMDRSNIKTEHPRVSSRGCSKVSNWVA